jgi:DNA-binding HxlR family transcriptional regulator
MDIIGDRWNFLIISASYFGVTRFDEYQSQLRIATNTLANRLTLLTKSGMLAKNRYREAPARYEYILTQKTLDFYQIPLMLALWGDRWLPVEEGDIYIRTHINCGNRLQIKPVCGDCEAEIKPGGFRVGGDDEH